MNRLLKNKELGIVQREFIHRYSVSDGKSNFVMSMIVAIIYAVASAGLLMRVERPDALPQLAWNIASFAVVLLVVLHAIVCFAAWAGFGCLIYSAVKLDELPKEARWDALPKIISAYESLPLLGKIGRSIVKFSSIAFMISLACGGHPVWSTFVLIAMAGSWIGVKSMEAGTISMLKEIKELPPEGWKSKAA